MRKIDKHCIDCGIKGVSERKRCDSCAKVYNSIRAKKRYAEQGRYNYGKSICVCCNKEMILWTRDQTKHSKCSFPDTKDYNKYRRDSSGTMIERATVVSLGVEIPLQHVVHHIDKNPENNTESNLLVMSVSDHAKLHAFLRKHRSILLKDSYENPENCWKILRDHLTTAWLEMTSAKVIKIGDIGQSAAESL